MNAVLDWTASIDPRWVLFGLLAVLNLWAATLVVFSTAARKEKLLWVVVLFTCPIIGAMLWFVFGPKWKADSG